MSRFSDALADVGYAAGWRFVRTLPEKQAHALFDRLADRTWRADGKSVQRLRGNYRQVVGPAMTDGELDELVRAGMRSYLRYWCEVFRLPTYTPELVRERMIMHNVGVLERALTDDRPAVAALSHSGNWDLVGLWFTQNHRGLTTVAERLKPESLFDRFVAYRESLGMEVLPLTGDANTYTRLMEAGREGRLVPLLADRDLTAKGIPVEFMGRPTRMPAGIGALAVDTGAQVVHIELWYEGAQLHGMAHTPILASGRGSRDEQISAVTQQMADQFTVAIRRHPADWHMMSRMWADVEPIARNVGGAVT